MRFIGKFILQILANALAIAIASYFIVQISFSGGIKDYLIVGGILALANLIIRPILRLVSAPLIFISFGLFLIVVNAVILFGVDYFVEELTITGFWGYVWATIIISILNAIIVGRAKKK